MNQTRNQVPKFRINYFEKKKFTEFSSERVEKYFRERWKKVLSTRKLSFCHRLIQPNKAELIQARP